MLVVVVLAWLVLFALPNLDVITSGRILSLLSTVPVFSALISRSSSIWTSSIKLFDFIGLPLARSFSGTAAFATGDDADVVVVVDGDVVAAGEGDGVALFSPFAIGFVTLVVDVAMVEDVPFSVGFVRLFSGHAGE